MDSTVVVLAAGQGKRMNSSLPKVLHKVAGTSLISVLLQSVFKAQCSRVIVVTGHKGELVRKHLGSSVEYVDQAEQLGTGHAVMQAVPLLSDVKGPVFVMCGDAPLIRPETLTALADQLNQGASAVVATMCLPDPGAYGRVVKDSLGQVLRIVEQKDASQVELEIKEVNSGLYAFLAEDLLEALSELSCDNAQKEYYLTDVVEILGRKSKRVEAFLLEDWQESLGVNSREDLALVEQLLQKRIAAKHMQEGVTLVAPHLTYIALDAQIGADSVIEPFVHVGNKVKIGSACHIGPHVCLEDGTILGNGERR